jgi:fructose-1,6-bisphosphatase/inositol monophosphatase family enzyme
LNIKLPDEKNKKNSIKITFFFVSFIGEETTAAEGGDAKVKFTDNPTWIIDPVDGTTNFVHKVPLCGISVALCINKKPQIGVFFNPINNETFSAIRGQGAFLNGSTMTSSGQKDLNLSLVVAEFGNNRLASDMDKKVANMRRIIDKAHGYTLIEIEFLF